MEDLEKLIEQLNKRKEYVKNEEQTKMSLVIPFLEYLGYEIYNPTEVIPEYTSDFGVKNGEKVDYAISINGELKVLIEAKTYGTKLGLAQVGQLYRYFSVTSASAGILTDGITYKVFSDTIKPNVMDSEPIIEFNLLELKDNDIENIAMLKRDSIDTLKGFTNKIDKVKKVSEYLLRCLNGEFDKDLASLVLRKCELGYDMRNQDNRDIYLDAVKKAVYSLLSGKAEEVKDEPTSSNSKLSNKSCGINYSKELTEEIISIEKYLGNLAVVISKCACETYVKVYKYSTAIGIKIDDKEYSVLNLHVTRTTRKVWGVTIPGYDGEEAKGDRKSVPYKDIETLERFERYIVERIKKIYES